MQPTTTFTHLPPYTQTHGHGVIPATVLQLQSLAIDGVEATCLRSAARFYRKLALCSSSFLAVNLSAQSQCKYQAAFKDIAKITGQRWRALSEAEREPFRLMAVQDIGRFRAEKVS